MGSINSVTSSASRGILERKSSRSRDHQKGPGSLRRPTGPEQKSAQEAIPPLHVLRPREHLFELVDEEYQARSPGPLGRCARVAGIRHAGGLKRFGEARL